MYKKITNSSDIKSKQLQVCELISRIWDSESLDIILGSIQNIIRVKRLVMSVDASCGSSQAFEGTVSNVTEHVEDRAEDRANNTTQIIDDEEHQSNTHVDQDDVQEHTRGAILVPDTQETWNNNATTQVMVVNEDGDYKTQVICNTLYAPRTNKISELEDSDSDSVFDIDWSGSDVEDDQHADQHPNNILNKTTTERDSDSDSLFDDIDWIGSDDEDDEPKKEEERQVQQEDDEERGATVAEYIKTPLQYINAQCPYKLTVEEVKRMFDNDELRQDFASMNTQVEALQDMFNSPSLRSPSTQTQSNYFINL